MKDTTNLEAALIAAWFYKQPARWDWGWVGEDIVFIGNNWPYKNFPKLRDRQRAWFIEKLTEIESEEGIPKLVATASYPLDGSGKGYTEVLLVKVSSRAPDVSAERILSLYEEALKIGTEEWCSCATKATTDSASSHQKDVSQH